MDYTQISIIKRDGKTEPFSLDKIVRAITKAFRAGGITDEGQAIEQIASDVAAAITKAEISVEEIQDMVEERLMKRNPSIAKRYIIYREWRNVERDRRSSIKSVMDGIVTVEKNDINLSNANMSSHTPAGQMMTFASEITKDYALKYLVGVRHGRAHRDGDIHIHDLDYYPTKTTTCIQYDLGDIYERGFSTKNGSVRTPQSIQSYATLATIIFQTNQNEQHGGQAIPAFDFFMYFVSTYGYQLKNSNCTPTTKTQINGFNFRPEVRGTYTFKFWNGKDANNNNVWIEKTIVVK
jgi:ribonucleoside-triphosphate reductase